MTYFGKSLETFSNRSSENTRALLLPILNRKVIKNPIARFSTRRRCTKGKKRDVKGAMMRVQQQTGRT